MKPFLHSPVVLTITEQFLIEKKKPVACVCHASLILGQNSSKGVPIAQGYKVSTVARWMEVIGYYLTKPVYGDYQISTTWPEYTEDILDRQLGADMVDSGPFRLVHTLHLSSENDHSRAHVVLDRNLVSARFYGDAHAFAQVFNIMLNK